MSSSSRSSSVTAVVTSRNEGTRLRETVHALLGTLPADGEVVVVDDASTDASADFLGPAYPSVRLVRPPERVGAAAGRNLGARAATGEVLVFCDAHVLPPAGWTAPVCAALGAAGVGAAGVGVSVEGRPDLRGYGLTWADAALNVTWLPRRGEQPYPVPILGAAVGARYGRRLAQTALRAVIVLVGLVAIVNLTL